MKKYKNGNYDVIILDDGTKIKILEDGESDFNAVFPDNIDVKLTNKCPIGCKYCHEGSVPSASTPYKNIEFLNKLFFNLQPGTELALGGGALSTIDSAYFSTFLDELHKIGVFTNITINQLELRNKKFLEFIEKEIEEKRIYGIGVSFQEKNDPIFESFVLRHRERVVIHVINGVVSKSDIKYLRKFSPKILILGYKKLRRGEEYIAEHSESINKNMKYLNKKVCKFSKNYFKTVSFDCLAIEQLNIREKVSKSEWDKFYMGDDGTQTMYIDVPNLQYAKSSTSLKRFDFKESDTVESIFSKIKEIGD